MIANFFIAFYFYDPGWIKRDTGATDGIYEPGSIIVRADEGYAITYVDSNGYVNQSADLTDTGYILIMGNSQSNGCNVMPDKKWVALLNSKIQNIKDEDLTQVYNISVGGYQFYNQLRGVEAAIKEFPNLSALVIQITTTDIPVEELRGKAVNQRAFMEESRGAYLAQHLDRQQIMRNGIKDFFPLIVYLSELKLSKIDIGFDEAFLHGNYDNMYSADNLNQGKEELQSYRNVLEETFMSLRDTYHGEIVILNIPDISLQTEKTIMINAGQYESVFQAVCEENDICYLNMGEVYQQEYRDKWIVPYGFSNTKPGTGHLNEEGHRMVADTLYTLLIERRVIR